jgi:hypothetical protein
VIPKGRDAGLAYARQFIEDAKSEGQVKVAIERVGMRGLRTRSPRVKSKWRSRGSECVAPLWLRFNDALRLPTATRRVAGVRMANV